MSARPATRPEDTAEMVRRWTRWLNAWEEAHFKAPDFVERFARLHRRDEFVAPEGFCGGNVDSVHGRQGNRFGLRQRGGHQDLIGLAPFGHPLEKSLQKLQLGFAFCGKLAEAAIQA